MAQRKVLPQEISAPPAVIAAIRSVLRPLVRLFLDYGVRLPTLMEMLKEIYVGVAKSEFPPADRKQSHSRISVMTGVHRKDVRRLQQTESPASKAPTSVLVGGQLIARWTGQAKFTDERGRPRKLPRLRRDGESSFEALVQSVSRDVGPRAILDELVRLGIASVDDDDRVCLNVAAFVPRSGVEEKAYYFGKNLHDHAAAATHNLRGGAPPFLERSVHYDRLAPEAVAELALIAEKLAMKGLQTINRRALVLKKRARGVSNNMRMNFGMYFYREPENKDVGENDSK